MEQTTIVIDLDSWDKLADLADFITESLTDA